LVGKMGDAVAVEGRLVCRMLCARRILVEETSGQEARKQKVVVELLGGYRRSCCNSASRVSQRESHVASVRRSSELWLR
jgi:hypothetical protein